jgi:3-oxoadipate enol-lactonase
MLVNGVELHVVDQGQGAPVLLVHGFPLDYSMWQFQLPVLAEHYRVIAPDLRGFGLSGGPGTDVVTMEQLADDLAGLLDALEIDEPVVLCGLSMGGYVAWQFWRRHRQKLKALILCDTRAAADSAEAAEQRRESAMRVLHEGCQALADGLLQKLFAAVTVKNQPALVKETRNVILSCAPLAVAAALRGMADRHDFSDSLPNIDCPALLLGGEVDAISPPTEMQGIAGKIPGARWEKIAAAGHMAPLEKPQEVNAILLDFLEAVGGRWLSGN